MEQENKPLTNIEMVGLFMYFSFVTGATAYMFISFLYVYQVAIAAFLSNENMLRLTY